MTPTGVLRGPTVRAFLKSYMLVGLALIVVAIVAFSLRLNADVEEQSQLTTRLLADLAAERLLSENPQQLHQLKNALDMVAVPVILTDASGRPLFWNANQVGIPLVDDPKVFQQDDPLAPKNPILARLMKKVKSFDAQRAPLPVNGPKGEAALFYLHYGESSLSRRLTVMPLLEAALIVAFMGVALVAFRNLKRSEERSLWVGMAKETAHQMGTPLTSMSGWLALLQEDEAATRDTAIQKAKALDGQKEKVLDGQKEKPLDGRETKPSRAGGTGPVPPTVGQAGIGRGQVLSELEKDHQRLAKVSARFSQIGSRPKLVSGRVDDLVKNACAYFDRRLPHLKTHVKIIADVEETPLAPINPDLLEWALENLIKNALDAIDKAQGMVKVQCRYDPRSLSVVITVTDNGKGMSPAVQRRIFNPGFSTREGGWGLGMVLVRRIVNEYHGGKVDVAWSEPGVGSTLRVRLKTR